MRERHPSGREAMDLLLTWLKSVDHVHVGEQLVYWANVEEYLADIRQANRVARDECNQMERRAVEAEHLIEHLESWKDSQGYTHDLTNPEHVVQPILNKLAEARAALDQVERDPATNPQLARLTALEKVAGYAQHSSCVPDADGRCTCWLWAAQEAFADLKSVEPAHRISNPALVADPCPVCCGSGKATSVFPGVPCGRCKGTGKDKSEKEKYDND